VKFTNPRCLAAIVLLAWAGASTLSRAARPMVTDDARLVDAGACQLEAWQRVNRGSRERWAFPACNPTGKLEVTLGGNDLPDGSGGRANDYVVQGKMLFRGLETNGYGFGLAAGAYFHGDPAPGQGQLKSAYFYVPISKSWLGDQLVVHVNLGAQSDRDAGTHPWTWGVGAESSLTSRLILIAESYGDGHARPSYQAGLRFWIVPNRFQVDATLGAQPGETTAPRWFSIGVRLVSLPFLK
jgi:hypothetical protein